MLRGTACASELAASDVARKDSQHLVMVGAGSLAPHLIRAHCAVRRYRRIEIWNRNRARAEEMAERLTDLQASIAVVDDLETAVHAADTVSCATLRREPLVRGEWIRHGMHVDPVCGFQPGRRGADDAPLPRAQS